MNKWVINALLIAALFSFYSCGVENNKFESLSATEPATLYGNSFLKGKISAITNSDGHGSDSTLFEYNENGHLVKAVFFTDGKEDGYCKYHYSSNEIRRHLYYHQKEEGQNR